MRRDALDALDDRISMLSRLDGAQRVGFAEGTVHGMQLIRWFRGDGPEPTKPRRTEYKFLQKHLERKFKRLAKAECK